MRLDGINLFVRLEIRTKRFTTSRGVMRLGALVHCASLYLIKFQNVEILPMDV